MQRMISIFALFSQVLVLSACGDMIRAPNPFKSKKRSEPKEQFTANFGMCSNFHGRWKILCDESSGIDDNDFFLTQTQCDLFVIQEGDRIFSRREVKSLDMENAFIERSVTWDETHKKLFLVENETIDDNVKVETFTFVESDSAKLGEYRISLKNKDDAETVSTCTLEQHR